MQGQQGLFTAVGTHLDMDPHPKGFSLVSVLPQLPARPRSLGKVGLQSCSHESPCLVFFIL